MRALRNRPARLTVAVLLLAGASLYMAPAADAAVTRVVDDDGKATVANCGATTPAPSTINAAVVAANAGDTIKVCPGTYTGTVDINKPGLIVNGPQVGVNATVRSFNAANEAVITTNGTTTDAVQISNDNITFDGFTVQASNVGINALAEGGGFAIRNNLVRGNVNGIELETIGTFPSVVTRNRLSWNNAGSSPPFEGNGIMSFLALNNVTIRDNGFLGQTTSGFISGNCSLGYNNGLQFIGNRFTNNAAGILLFNNQTNIKIFGTHFDDTLHPGLGPPAILIGPDVTNVTIGAPNRGNTINHSPADGIAVNDVSGFCGGTAPGLPGGPIKIQNNTVSNSYYSGVYVDSAIVGRAQVLNNTLTDNNTGIDFTSQTSGNTITSNNASGSANYDCQDASTGGSAGAPNYTTQNSWVNNIGELAYPAEICT